MSVQGILGIVGTATVEVAEVERLVVERNEARDERDRARRLAARLEEIVAGDHALLRRVLDPDTFASFASEEQLGFEIAAWLIEHGGMHGGASC